MSSDITHTKRTYAQQLADEMKTLVPGMERVAAIAAEMRADDLYRLLGFDTWERFCSDFLGVSKSTANRWIAGTAKRTELGVGDTEQAKTKNAGQGVAAAQNAPVVESTTLKVEPREEPSTSTTADAAETSSPAPEPAPTSTVIPSGASHANPTSTISTNVPSGSGHGSPSTEQTVPSNAEDEPVDVDRIGLRWLQSKNDQQVRAIGPPWRPVIETEIRRWAQNLGLTVGRAVEEPPKRSPGRVIRPEDRARTADFKPTPPPAERRVLTGVPSGTIRKRHADDCSCFGCKPPKAAKG